MRRLLIIGLTCLLVLLVVAAAALIFVYRASQQVPDFYTEIATEKPETQDRKSDEMIQRATSLHNDLVTEGRWRAEFTADEINAWLAIDLARNHADSLPPGVSDPRVAIHQDELTVGCKVSRGGLHGIVWVDLGITMLAPDSDTETESTAKSSEKSAPARFAVRIRKVRLGSIPWPLDNIMKSISDAARLNEVRINWEQDIKSGDPVAVVTVPTKLLRHGQHVQLDAIRLEPGKIIIAGTTSKD